MLSDPLAPLNDSQQRVVDIVAEVFLLHGRWPILDYVERTLDAERLDGPSVVAGFRRAGAAGGAYSAIWMTDASRESVIGLTVLGMNHSKLMSVGSVPWQLGYFDVLEHFIKLLRAQPVSPFQLSDVSAPRDHVLTVLAKRGISGELLTSTALYQLLQHEPPTWYGARGGPESAWEWGVTRHVLAYDGVTDVSDYVERIVRSVQTPPAVSRAVPSPLALSATFDYLDAIWQLVPGHDAGLVRLQSAERTAKLALPAQTEDELQARLSALGEVLTSLRVPGLTVAAGRGNRSDDPTLRRLRAYLLQKTAAVAHARLSAEIDTLQNLIDLRHGVHHGSGATRSKAAAAYEQLGINYPPTDWAGTWEAIQVSAVEALEGIREEIAVLTRR